MELSIDPEVIVFTREIAQDKEHLDQTAIFLQGPREDILQGIRL